MNQPPDPRTSAKTTLVAAGAFLIISLLAAIGAIVFALTPPAALSTQTTPEEAQASPESPDQTAVSAATPTLSPETDLVISLASLDAASVAETEQFQRKLTEVLATSPSTYFARIEMVKLPADTSPAHLEAVMPDSAMLVAIESSSNDLAGVHIVTPTSAPALLLLEGGLSPQPVIAPGSNAIYSARGGEQTLAAQIAVMALEIERGDVTTASQRLLTAEALPPDVPPEAASQNQAILAFMQGHLLIAQGDLPGALQAYSQTLRLADGFALAHNNRGNVYMQLGDTQAGLAEYEAALSAQPDLQVARYNHAIALWLGGNLSEAYTEADQLVAELPEALWALNLRGVIAAKQGNDEGALSDFEAASTLDTGLVVPLHNKALMLTRMGRYDDALQAYDALQGLEPNNPTFHYLMGTVYHLAGKLPQAGQALDRALNLDSQYADAYLERARVNMATGALDRVQADIQTAIDLRPEDYKGYQLLGDLFLQQEKYREADQAYTESVDRGGGDSALYAGRAWARHRQQSLGRAISDYEQAIALGDQDAELLFRLGFAYFDRGFYDKALAAFSGATNGGIDTAEMHAAMAIGLDANLHRDEAELEYQKALDLDPKLSDEKYLASLPLWSPSAIRRARSILKRME
jgi:tetratricopeptide (TPR) repeat protein